MPLCIQKNMDTRDIHKGIKSVVFQYGCIATIWSLPGDPLPVWIYSYSLHSQSKWKGGGKHLGGIFLFNLPPPPKQKIIYLVNSILNYACDKKNKP